MNPPISITIGSADPNAAPLTVNELFALLQNVITAEIFGSYIPYILGHDTPSVDDQDKAWIELDTQGRPLAIKTFYNGLWRRVYNGMIGEIRGYSGDPSIDFEMTDPNPGVGKIGGRYDGWYLCNGKNGTPNLSDKFLIGGHMDNSNGHVGYNNGWQSAITTPSGTVNDYKTGGQFVETLLPANIPTQPASIKFDTGGLAKLYKWKADGNAQDDSGDLWGLDNPGATPHQIIDDTPANATPTPIWTTPPFISLGWIIFKGY